MLDEPTTGLSFQDVAHLLNVLERLADAGNTVLVIEHHLDVIKTADHIIDLGPLGGDRGGELVGTGTPEEIAAHPTSYTGEYLRPILAAAGTFVGKVTAAKPARNGKLKPGVAAEAAPTAAVAARTNGRKATAAGPDPEASAKRAAASIGARIERESTPQEPRPQTKAAAKRARQAANPRKETASERSLREKREGQ